MKPFLFLALLLSGCTALQSPDGALLERRDGFDWDGDGFPDTGTVQHCVPFEGGKVLHLNHGGRSYWREGTNPFGNRLAQGFRAPVMGDRVVLVTAWGTIPGEVVGTDGPWAWVRMAREVEPGMSGAGLWYEDGFLAGTARKRVIEDHRLLLSRIPFVDDAGER